jgi:NAD(P)H dehydrogenase (quinone)
MKITIIYDTKTGNTKRMAQAVAEGAEGFEGIEVIMKHIDDASPEDLLSEGLVIGSPTYCGLMTWKLKKLFDESVKTAWGKVDGHIGAAFSSSGGLGGGNEISLCSILTSLMNYGFIVFGLTEYAGRGVTAHYGAVAVGDPGELEVKACRRLGEKTAEYVSRMFGGNRKEE